MKWTSLLGSLVLGFAVCTQSYGFELLDRMLGASGCGCETSCCETKCRKHHHRGCNTGCDSCAAAPSCCAAAPSCAAPSCAAAPSCGCEQSCNTGCGHRHHGLFGGHHNKGCCNTCAAPTCAAPTCAAAPSCGCEQSCNTGCCKKSCWLHRIFSCHKRCHNGCNTGCDTGCGAAAPSCGCDGGVMSGGKELPPQAGGDLAPMPPAPVVDPSAFLPTQRRVVHASTSLVR